MRIPGNLLSCYTAGISAYMEHQQIDHQLVLGTQLFLGAFEKGNSWRIRRAQEVSASSRTRTRERPYYGRASATLKRLSEKET
jgi:hypothetical protein